MWPVLVEALGDLHRVPGGEAVLAVRLLLERAGGERRVGPGGVRLVLELGHPPLGRAEPLQQFGRLPLVQLEQPGVLQPAGGRVEVAAGRHPPAVKRSQLGLETWPSVGPDGRSRLHVGPACRAGH